LIRLNVIQVEGRGEITVADEHEAEVARITVTLLRALPKWDRTRLSDESGIHRSQICVYEKGKIVPGLKNLQRLAAAVDVQPSLLAHIESFVSELLAAWKQGRSSGPVSDEAPSSSGEESAWAAEVVQEAAQARAELALLGGRPSTSAPPEGREK
jgi:transcriptional regulator with XRE-family HTH domain